MRRNRAKALSHSAFVSGLFAGCLFGASPSLALDSVCATVKIEINQELTLERQAFDARMQIANGLPSDAVENVRVVVRVTDSAGNPVAITADPDNTTATFFVREDSMTGIGAVDGTGTVAASTTADIHWLLIPARGASNGNVNGTAYDVGATLSYNISGTPFSHDVAPDRILVKPMPALALDYFLPQDVYADDAFTPEIEPAVPFTFGLRVKNNGPGDAKSVRISSAQPRIVENEQGLLIGFLIEGTEVNGQPAAETLLANLGNIAANTAGIARWIMTTSLSGEFTQFSAAYTHADALGGQVTSLIEGVATHTLLHDVLVDLPGRDGIRDFLADDLGVLSVYESQSLQSSVSDLYTGA
ncbi:MAG: calcium-binding protein, partial [Candidatus Geothermincolia bacterium]